MIEEKRIIIPIRSVVFFTNMAKCGFKEIYYQQRAQTELNCTKESPKHCHRVIKNTQHKTKLGKTQRKPPFP